MTDLETFQAMLRRTGIEWTDYDDGDGEFPPETGQPGDTVICVHPSREPTPVVGYIMFRTDFAFAPDGSLRSIGCWE